MAANAINNVLLKPGEEFSFNDIVGERTEEKGYKYAESIDDKKIVETVGGGICQVSTTLHMAIKKIPLMVTEVHEHSIPINYSIREDEAAVSWGELDFKFINTYNSSIKIETIIDMTSGKVIVNIYKI